MASRFYADTIAFASRLRTLGFDVYIAERGDYGFVTDKERARVMSFSFNDGSLSGNYGPPSFASGTGWRIEGNPWDLQTAEQVKKALYAQPPKWCGNGWKYLSTVEQYQAHYQSSSKFKLFEG